VRPAHHYAPQVRRKLVFEPICKAGGLSATYTRVRKELEVNMKSACDRLSGPREEELRNHVLIAPAGWSRVLGFSRATVDPEGHAELMGAIQRFRGGCYLADGAIRPEELTADGRHVQTMDEESWHLVIRSDDGNVISCARYHSVDDPRFEKTAAASSALAQSPDWRGKVARIVEESIRQANERGAHFAELGGWCVADVSRHSRHALRSVLYMFALGEILGGTIGLSTATTRHCSSSILQRLGARRAELDGEVLPSYFDRRFDCDMELLQFDSLRPSPKYARQVSEYRSMIRSDMRVLCAVEAAPTSIESLTRLLAALTAPTAAPAVPQIA
jgi:hypothetical protein